MAISSCRDRRRGGGRSGAAFGARASAASPSAEAAFWLKYGAPWAALKRERPPVGQVRAPALRPRRQRGPESAPPVRLLRRGERQGLELAARASAEAREQRSRSPWRSPRPRGAVVW